MYLFKETRKKKRQKSHFRLYILRRFPLWSPDFIFSAFSPYPEKRFSFWSISIHWRQKMHTWQTIELKKYILKIFYFILKQNKILIINNFKIKVLKILVENNCFSCSSPKNMVAQKIRNSRFSSHLFHFLSIQTSKNIYKTRIKLKYSNTIN